MSDSNPEAHDHRNAEMHTRSGAVHDHDPLVSVLYDLLRDHVQPGDLESLVRDACKYAGSVKVYSNGWLAAYAQDIATRLRVAFADGSHTTTPVRK